MNDNHTLRASTKRWLLLIYTIPALPSRKRAFVWRELKKLGAVYLRDGVAVLPDTGPTVLAFRALAARIAKLDGQATLIADVHLDPAPIARVEHTSRAERESEYAALDAEAVRLAEHIEREHGHREFAFPEIEAFTTDLRKLCEWAEQIESRDYFAASGHGAAVAALERCTALLQRFVVQASEEADRLDEAPM